MKIAILFTHHKKDEITIQNFNQLKKHNVNHQIFTAGFKHMDLFEGSYIVDEDENYLPKNKNFVKNLRERYWTQADLLIYDFFYRHQNQFDKLLVIEWDTYCNCSIEEFYGDSLSKDSFAHELFNPADEKWIWYNQLSVEHKKNFKKFYGYSPTSGIYLSSNILERILDILMRESEKYNDMFSEIRLGTLIKNAGGNLSLPFANADKFISWKKSLINFDNTIKGYYHPIKEIII